MNTGLQDGWNLAWKIALVAQGRAPDALLDSYHAERHDIGRQMLALSDRTHRLVFEHHAGVAARARRSLAGFLAEHHVIHPPLRTADQTRVAYHRSPIVGESGAGPAGPAWYAAPRPGDRAPDGALADANGAPVRLFAATRAPVHHLLVFAGPAAGADVAAAHGFAATATAGCAAPIAPHLVVCGDAADTATGDAILRDPGGALHARYGAAAACAYLLRPDGHVGWRSPTLDAAALRRYLGAVFG
jgi:hypothetical protein